MILCIAMSQGMRVRYTTMTQNWKAGYLNIVTPLLPERKNSRINLLLEDKIEGKKIKLQEKKKKNHKASSTW
jgi:hypothetical protein